MIVSALPMKAKSASTAVLTAAPCLTASACSAVTWAALKMSSVVPLRPSAPAPRWFGMNAAKAVFAAALTVLKVMVLALLS